MEGAASSQKGGAEMFIVIGIAVIAFILGYALGRVNTLIRYKEKAVALLIECREKSLSSAICELVEKHF